MASRNVSPGGALLRASRVFSLPPPLPQPENALSSRAVFGSNTATLPHPIHQTVTTPQASLARGDWGFKRPLPLRSTTKTSTPFLRVKTIDTWEHITEFHSSADHTISLQKWQEMGVPLTIPAKSRVGQLGAIGQKSVFEEDIDSTADVSRDEDNRWKFKGPWLAGQTDGDFNKFIATEVRGRKLEFQQYLREACAKSLTAEARRTATEQGMSEEKVPPMEASDITEEQLMNYTKVLRNERVNLYRLVRSFLDLPPAPGKSIEDKILNTLRTVDLENLLPDSRSPYANTGPPKTHPSAGLAYIRSSQYMHNHPLWGPQRSKLPIKARVVMPKAAATGAFAPVLGVGGFVTDIPDSGDYREDGSRSYKKSKPATGIEKIDPDQVGGSKIWVQPSRAKIDTKGRVVLTVGYADEESVAVLEGTTAQIVKPKALATPGVVERSTGFSGMRNESRGYGLGSSGRGDAQSTTAGPQITNIEEGKKALNRMMDS